MFRFPNETGERATRTYKRVDAMVTHPKYLQAVPVNERMSRADLIAQGNKYFTGMQKNDGKGDYPFAPECERHENGGQSHQPPTPAGQTRPDPKTATVYSAQWSCLEQFQSGLIHFVNRIRDRRFVAVDQERGIVFAFAFFDHSGGETRTFKTPVGPRGGGRSRAAVDLADRRDLQDREGPDHQDRRLPAALAPTA